MEGSYWWISWKNMFKFLEPIIFIFLYFIQEVLLVITYSVLSLTALSILYSLNTVSESSSQNGSSHGTSIINQEMNEHVIKVDFDLFLIIEMLLIVCGDVELNPGPITNDVSCSKCNLTFSTPQKMSIHEKRVHDDRVLKCFQKHLKNIMY